MGKYSGVPLFELEEDTVSVAGVLFESEEVLGGVGSLGDATVIVLDESVVVILLSAVAVAEMRMV